MVRLRHLLLPLALLLTFNASIVLAASPVVRDQRPDGVYRAGETIRWLVTLPDPSVPAPAISYTVKRGGLTEVASGTLSFRAGQAEVAYRLEQPDTLLLELTWQDGDEQQKLLAGAVASPEKIRPAEPAPDDFDSFWAAQLAASRAVPLNPREEPADSQVAGVERWKITLDHVGSAHVRGQLARPSDGDNLPALLIVQWAGVYGLQPEWVTNRARQGWLVLNILAHDLPIDEPEGFYTAQREGSLQDYGAIGNESPNTSYFLRMYLSCHRAVEYLKTRPEWDGRTLVVMGGSQGGQQALVTAGLHPDVTAALAHVPAGADTLAPTEGRAAAFPFWKIDTPSVRETSRYFDVAHFAARARCPVLVSVALEDTVCPPATIFAAINQLPGYKEVVILPKAGHQNVNGSHDAYHRREEQGWLPALRANLPPPAVLTAGEDHARLLKLLGIEALRSGASPDPAAPNAANTDETRATPYPELPPLLEMADGTAVDTPAEWWSRRRPEIAEAFAREVYGQVPADVPAVHWKVLDTYAERKGGIPVLTQRLSGVVDNAAYPFLHVAIDLTVSVPTAATAPVPVMLHFGWPPSFLSLFPPTEGPTWEEQVLAKGWAAAVILPTSFQADNGAGLTQGIIGLCNRGQPRDPNDWGALRAWAWGASRALDYFEQAPALDGRRVGLEGLSRYGKAVLVAMATDPRFAVAFVGSSGAGGAKLHRRHFGEQVENLAGTGTYHWMAGNYLKYAGPLTPDDLPVDAHQLIALCAPRPVFIGAGSGEVEGHWIDQRGMFLAAAAADPAYELLGDEGLPTTEMPPIGEGLLEGRLAWRQHAGGHTALPNWPAFLAWADDYLDAAPARWISTWSSAQQITEPHNLPPAPGFAGATVRQKLMTSIGGDQVRVRFSNAFGDAPVTIKAAAIALAGPEDAIEPQTSQPVTFNGAASVTLRAGAEWLSDPIDTALEPMAHLAVTFQLEGAPAHVTGHPGSRTTSYFHYGDAPVDAPALPGATPVEHWYFLTSVDVRTKAPDAAAIAIVGDSITDGRGSTTNGNDRWPDQLSRRLRAHPATAHVAVLNQGIGGNRILSDGLGPHLLARLDRDVLAQPGVKWLIVLHGINDLGTAAQQRAKGEPAPGATEMIAALDQVVTRTRDHGIKVIGGTIMPFEGAFYYSAEGEADRQAVNRWIRHSGRFDAVIDFDAIARDPAHPTRLRAEVDTGDHLHLSAAGLKRLADAIDLTLFQSTAAAEVPEPAAAR